MRPASFGADPMAGAPGPTEGGLGVDPLETHMKAFQAALKRSDPRGMAEAFKAAHRECMMYESEGDGADDADDAIGGMVG